MGRRGAYYNDGFSDGADAAMDTDWGPGELKDAVERDRLGDVAGEVLSNWQQMAGTIYYDESVTENQLSAWEEGFYAGFASQAEMMAGKKRPRKKRASRKGGGFDERSHYLTEANPKKKRARSGDRPMSEREWQERAILEIEAAVRSGKLTREEEKRMLKELGIRSNPKGAYSTTFHRDGSITFWSAYQQRWIRTRDISDRELAAMSEKERGRVLHHLLRR